MSEPSEEAIKIAKDFEYHCERNPEEGLATAYVARVVDRALLHECEECAKIAEAHKIQMDGVDTRAIHGNGMATSIAEAIRARGKR